MSDAARAVIVTVGDELLLGETVDSNAAWLGRALSRLGLNVLRRHTVGDVAADIRDAVRQGVESADVVVLTGGLGPTEDDLTRPAVAEELGATLHTRDDLVEDLRRRFRRHGVERFPVSNVRQAQVPEGAEVLPNPRGSAPGLLMATDGGVLVALLPGVPSEMKGIFAEELAPRLEARLGDRLRPVRHRIIHTTGFSESALADAVEERLTGDLAPVSLAFLPDLHGVDLRLTVRGVEDADEASRHLDRVEALLADIVAPYRFEADESGDLIETVSRALAEAGLVLAAAESCTGGLVAKRMTDRPGASAVFVGGVVAYADPVKRELLGVEDAVLRRDGAVSEAVARAMALGVARRLGADCGIGITGIAGPDGGTEEKPVGLVWYAAAVGDRVEARSRVFPGDREAVRGRSAQAALALLFRLLQDAQAPQDALARQDGGNARNGGDAAETAGSDAEAGDGEAGAGPRGASA